MSTFSEVKLFQVKPDRLDEFEALVQSAAQAQRQCEGCMGIRYMKRFYVFDDIQSPPRQLTKIVKCVKYFSYWEFDTLDHYAQATRWFFDRYYQDVARLLLMPFDIHCGDTVC